MSTINNRTSNIPRGPRSSSKLTTRLVNMTIPMSPVKQLVFRIALPHVVLVSLSSVYLLVGALVFQQLEGSTNLTPNTSIAYQILNVEDNLVENIVPVSDQWTRENNEELFVNFTAALERIYLTGAVHNGTVIEGGNFLDFLFFTVTTMTSLGYGDRAPRSWLGKLFCIAVCSFGIPLILVTIADIAKFLSEILVKLYISYRKLCLHLTLKREKRPLIGKKTNNQRTQSIVKALAQHAEALTTGGVSTFEDTFIIPTNASDEDIAELIWENLETTEFVEVPAPLVLCIMALYALLGALLFSYIEPWSIFDAFYFSVTSILKIGFGDFAPRNTLLVPVALLYLIFGLMITTMGLDLVGVRYLSRLHQFGRRVEDTDYLGWLIAIQMRRKKRKAMKELLLILYHTTMPFMQMHDEMRGPTPVKPKTLPKLRSPPEPPANARAVDTTAHSVLLTWDPSPDAAEELVVYGISYKPKGLRENRKYSVRTVPAQARGEVRGIIGTMCEVKNLRSFTLYEFLLYAEFGGGSEQSDKISILHYTEPDSVPQSLRAEIVDSQSIRIMWSPPLRNRSGANKQYSVYYTTKANDPFEKWTKASLTEHSELVVNNLSPDTHHSFCVSASHNLGMAMVSRAVAIKTPADDSFLDSGTGTDGKPGFKLINRGLSHFPPRKLSGDLLTPLLRRLSRAGPSSALPTRKYVNADKGQKWRKISEAMAKPDSLHLRSFSCPKIDTVASQS